MSVSPASKQVIATVVSSMIASGIGGALSVYVTMRLLEQRIDATDTRLREFWQSTDGKFREYAQEIASIRVIFEASRTASDTRFSAFRDELSRISADVSYVRGAMENNKTR